MALQQGRPTRTAAHRLLLLADMADTQGRPTICRLLKRFGPASVLLVLSDIGSFAGAISCNRRPGDWLPSKTL